jgi:nucleotide-binding universal stress UspA family protein
MLPVYRTILFACDLSENAPHVFRHALNLARAQEGKIHILHVMPELGSEAAAYVSNLIGKDRFEQLENEHEGEAKAELRAQMDRLVQLELKECTDDWCRVAEIEVHRGQPVVEILKAGDRLNADLIVLGSHGKGTLKHAFLGSVAEKVLRNSHRPVLTVPIGPGQFWMKGEGTSPSRAE